MSSSSRKPPGGDFYQQRLKAWQPILTPTWVVVTFLAVGVIFVPIGFILKAASDSVVEVSIPYGFDGATHCTDGNSACTVAITIPEDMEPPVYVYYELRNFYQNHRRYVKSRSDAQLQGELISYDNLVDCDPLRTLPGNTGPNPPALFPCGLIAYSFFNDSYTFPAQYPLIESGIAWESDKDKFKNPSQAAIDAATGQEWLWDVIPFMEGNDEVGRRLENEHFIVWMRTAALPTFRKLYGRVDNEKLAKGSTLQVDISNVYDVDSFDGEKRLVLSTMSWMGGKNDFLGIAYIVVGFLCIVLGALFWAKQRFCGRALGDTDFLVWNAHRR
jgi:hypothetical protein